MIPYFQGTPKYWRYEVSGELEAAVNAYFKPYNDNSEISELSDRHIQLLKEYLLHWAEAPVWRQNSHAEVGQLEKLDRAIARIKAVNTRQDIGQCIIELSYLGIDPF